MNDFFEKMSDANKGILLIIVGSILLIHTLGFIERGLNVIIILGSLLMIFYGAFLLRHGMFKTYYQKIIARLKKKEKKE
ncbi:hypothetical protein E3J79_03925 [Candidatus Dependentiae bacterium]|nr:MAG: hypothetical protein E3J79_03925 [Candidatus Dependentiae bacterium]